MVRVLRDAEVKTIDVPTRQHGVSIFTRNTNNPSAKKRGAANLEYAATDSRHRMNWTMSVEAGSARIQIKPPDNYHSAL